MGGVAHCGGHTPPYPGSLRRLTARQGRCASPPAISAYGLTLDPLALSLSAYTQHLTIHLRSTYDPLTIG